MASRLVKLASIAFLGLATAGLAQAGDRPPKRPNVIVIVTDDQGYADVGFNGSKDIATPGIDRIAREGVRFTRGYVTFPVCGPSRAALLTGRHNARFGYDRNPNGDPSDPRGGIPRSEEIMSEMLKRGGYDTMAIGKWHMGTHPTLRPRSRGFDEFYGFLEGGHRYFPEEVTMEDISQSKKLYDWYYTKLVDNGARVGFKQYLTDEFSDRAVSFVQRKAKGNKPFFLYLAYNAPHAPLQATEKYLARFANVTDPNRRTYLAMIGAVDDGVGRVLAELDAQGIADDTVVFFLSDNGGVTNTDTGEPPAARNAPLRGGKSSLFEGGVRVPMAVRWPRGIKGGRDFTRPVSSMDIFATLAVASGIAPRADRPLDGVDLVPYLAGTKTGDPQPVLFWRKFDQGQRALIAGDLKYMDNGQGPLLFNLRADGGEKASIAKGNEANIAKLDKLWSFWNAQMAKQPAFPPLGTWPANPAKGAQPPAKRQSAEPAQ